MRTAPRFTAATIAIVASLGLSACGTGFDAQTNQQYQAAAGANHREGDVEIHGAVLVENADGTATLAGTLLNTSDQVQQLAGFSAETLEGDVLKTSKNPPLDLPVDEALQLGKDKQFVITVDDVAAGDYVTLTFEFSGSDAVQLNVPVDDRNDWYDDIIGEKPTDEEAAEEEAAH